MFGKKEKLDPYITLKFKYLKTVLRKETIKLFRTLKEKLHEQNPL